MRKVAVMLAAVWLAFACTGFAQQPAAPARDAGASPSEEKAKADSDPVKKQARKERREHRKAISHRHRRKH